MTTSKTYAIEPSWQALLTDLGASPQRVLRRAQLPEDLFTRGDVQLKQNSWFQLWDSIAMDVADPCFPLKLAQAMTAETFSPPLFAALCSPNLGIAVQRISHYKRLIAPMRLDVCRHVNGLDLEFEWLDTTVAPPVTLVAAELAFIVQLARIATRERIEPLRVTTPCPPEPASAFGDFFGVSVLAGNSHSIRFAMADAERPFLTTNATVWSIFEPDLRRRLAELDDTATTAERVRACLLELLPSGQMTMAEVASRLALSKRTLQRRLQAEGIPFQLVLCQTREQLAQHYLANTRLAHAEIAYLLGFDDPNSFYRAFHSWTGQTPEQQRLNAQHSF